MLPNGKTHLLALFGKDLSYSISPKLQNEWADRENINSIYMPITLLSDSHFVSLIEPLMICPNFLGGNITNPYKSVLVEHAKRLHIHCDEITTQIGAANTLFRSSESWCLTNTDVDGIKASLIRLGIPPNPVPSNTDPAYASNSEQHSRSRFALIVGGGGAAAAAAYTIATHFPQFTISVICRSAERAHPYLKKAVQLIQVSDNLEETAALPSLYLSDSTDETTKEKYFLVINTLPLGQKAEENPICQKLLSSSIISNSKASWFFDMTYGNPPAIQVARKRNIPAIDGRLMLETQAFKSFAVWKDSLRLDQ